ncbi:MAG: hypothetical protein M1817_005806 [Caeruleum heppii]|nr:MAG: hypothetical protein M1817_005806 [Caeruleum heppii]
MAITRVILEYCSSMAVEEREVAIDPMQLAAVDLSLRAMSGNPPAARVDPEVGKPSRFKLQTLTAHMVDAPGAPAIVRRRSILGTVWRSIASMILEAADAPEERSALILYHVRQIIAHLHQADLIPDSLYNYPLQNGSATLWRPPALQLLYSRILTSLSDAVWRAHEEKASAEAAATGTQQRFLGYDVPGTRYKLKVRDLGPEVWMEFALWSCIEGGLVQEAAQILQQILDRPQGSQRWGVIRWDLVQGSSVDDSKSARVDWDGIKSRTGGMVGRIEGYSGDPPFVELGPRTISTESVTAVIDSLIAGLPVNWAHQGTPWSALGLIKELLDMLSRDGYVRSDDEWDRMLLRVFESARSPFPATHDTLKEQLDVINALDPTAVTANTQAKDFVHIPTKRQSVIVRSVLQDACSVAIENADLNSALSTFLQLLPGSARIAFVRTGRPYGSDGIISTGDSEGNFVCPRCDHLLGGTEKLAEHLRRASRCALSSDQPSAERPGRTSTATAERAHSTSADSADKRLVHEDANTSSLTVGFPVATALLARLLDLVTEAEAFDVGRWLFRGAGLQQPAIEEAMFTDPELTPSVLRFAGLTADTDILIKIASSLPPSIPLATLQALLQYQIMVENWQNVEDLLRHLDEVADGSWTTHIQVLLTKAILRLERRSRTGSSSSAVSIRHPTSLDTAISLLQRLIQGDYGRPDSGNGLPEMNVDAHCDAILRMCASASPTVMSICPSAHDAPPKKGLHGKVPPRIFNTLLREVVRDHGSQGGLEFWFLWCQDAPLTDLVRDGGPKIPRLPPEARLSSSPLLPATIRLPGKGFPPWMSGGSRREQLVKPNLLTVHIILGKAIEEREDIKASSAEENRRLDALVDHQTLSKIEEVIEWGQDMLQRVELS